MNLELSFVTLALTPGREEARRWAEKELLKEEYQEANLNFFERFMRALDRFLSDSLDRLSNVEHPFLTVTIFLAIVAAIIFFIWRLRRGYGDAFERALFEATGIDVNIDVAQARAQAASAAEGGNFSTACQYRYRALVGELANRGDVTLSGSTTAGDVTREALGAHPGLAGELRRAEELFDYVSFGDLKASAQDYAFMVSVDDAVAQAPHRNSAGVSA